MKDQYIKNEKYEIKGRLRTESNGDQSLFDKTGKLLGRYNSNHGRSYDATGKPLGNSPGQLFSLFG